MVGETYGCDTCPHSNPHNPIDAKFTWKDGERIPTGKCTEPGTCHEGRHTKWTCRCVEHKEHKESEESV